MSQLSQGHAIATYPNVQLGSREYPVYEVVPSQSRTGGFRDLVGLLQRLVASDAVVIVREPLSTYGGTEDENNSWSRMGILEGILATHILASSLVDAMVARGTRALLDGLRLRHLGGGFIVAQKTTRRALLNTLAGPSAAHCSLSPELVPVAAFQEFRALWDQSELPCQPRHGTARKQKLSLSYFAEVGKNLGTMHARGALQGDVHTGNFLPIPVDAGSARFPLLGPSTHQCASEIATLLPELDPAEWEAFKTGYVAAREIDGLCVLSLIETGREQRGALLMHGDPAQALPVLLQELNEQIAAGERDLFASYCNIGLCQSRLKHHAEAVAAYEKAAECLDPDEDDSMKLLLHYNWGIALHRGLEYEAAVRHLEIVRQAERDLCRRLSFYGSALRHLFDSYEKLGAIKEAASVANEIVSIRKEIERK